MTPRLHTLSFAPLIPNELYREIIENLHYFKDRNTLVRLAQVSKAWCVESQRVLFRTVCDDSAHLGKHKSLIHTHIHFLKAIILNPSRLGPLVQTYHQRELMCHPFFRANPDLLLADADSAHYLWDLTAKALPALVNLKHLSITPQQNRRRSPRAYLLEGCTFKLKSLRWGFEPHTSNDSDPLGDFLRTQPNLLLLEDGPEPSTQKFSWLTDDMCPNLTSTACRLESATRVMAKRSKIVGMKIWTRTSESVQLSRLHRLKYLSISAHPDLLSHWGATKSDTILLELEKWNRQTIETLHGFPNLRVLVLLQEPHPFTWSSRQARALMNPEEEQNLRMQLTITSFHRCPNLEYVIIEDIPRGPGRRCYTKLFITGLNGTLTNEPGEVVMSERFPLIHEPEVPWWTAYGIGI